MLDSKILTTLEYPKIIDKLTKHASTSLGKSAAEALKPATELEDVKTLLQATDEAYAADRLKGSAPFGGVVDITAPLHRARIGGTLNPGEL
ncbi:MAG: MutS2 family protein, partial [Paenibacillus sp.]|nr:MutS2 family protein [Paenibacillus sp.]